MTAAAKGHGLSLGLKRIKPNQGSAKRKRCSRPKAFHCPNAPNENTIRTTILPMNPNREEVLFALALEKPAEKRAALLDATCDGVRPCANAAHLQPLNSAFRPHKP
jgi:hypothetical protein